MSRALPARRIWAPPIALGVLSLVGLVAALVTDGWGDALSALALAVPAAVGLWGFHGRPAPAPRTGPPVEHRAVRPARPPR